VYSFAGEAKILIQDVSFDELTLNPADLISIPFAVSCSQIKTAYDIEHGQLYITCFDAEGSKIEQAIYDVDAPSITEYTKVAAPDVPVASNYFPVMGPCSQAFHYVNTSDFYSCTECTKRVASNNLRLVPLECEDDFRVWTLCSDDRPLVVMG